MLINFRQPLQITAELS